MEYKNTLICGDMEYETETCMGIKYQTNTPA
jgi:hypothetical protein